MQEVKYMKTCCWKCNVGSLYFQQSAIRMARTQKTLSAHINLKHTSNDPELTALINYSKQCVLPSTKHPDLCNGHTVFCHIGTPVNIFRWDSCTEGLINIWLGIFMALLMKTFLLGYDATFIGGFLPTFQRSLFPPLTGQPKKINCWVNMLHHIGGVQVRSKLKPHLLAYYNYHLTCSSCSQQLILCPEHGGSTLLWNVSKSTVNMVTYPRTL